MASALPEPIFASESENQLIERLVELLKAELLQVVLAGTDDEVIVLPESLCRILSQAIHLMAAGKGVSVRAVDRELTTQEAAILLNMPQHFLLKLLEQGDILYNIFGSHQRIHFADLIAYRQERDRKRREALDELTQMSQDEGFYD